MMHDTVDVNTVPAQRKDIGTRHAAREDVELTDNSCWSFSRLGFLFCCNTCFSVPERTAVVQLFFGKYVGTITEPGCYCRSIWFTEFRSVSTAVTPIDLANVKVADSNGRYGPAIVLSASIEDSLAHVSLCTVSRCEY
jgi:hypothetical protein